MNSVPNSNYSILPAEEADIPAIAQGLLASKLALTINRLLWKDWPNETAQLQNCVNALSSSFKDPMTELFIKAVDGKTGEIVGHLVVTRKNKRSDDSSPPETGKPAKEDPEAEKPKSGADGMNPEVLAAVIKAVTELDGDMEGIKHLQLTHIYIRPVHRKHGIGSQMVQMCHDKAKETGLPLVFSSEPAAHEFFLKRGFKDTKHVDFDLDKWAEKFSGFGKFRLAGMAAVV